MSKAIRVKKGSEILEIQDSDLQAAVKDGYLPTERVIVANSKTNESYEIDPQDLPNAFKDGFTYSDVKKKVGGLGAAVGGEAGISGLPSEEEKVRYPQLKEGQEIVEYPAFGGYTIGYKKPEKIGGQEQMQREKDPYAFNEKELTSKITKAENPENIKERHQVTSKDPITGVSYIDKLKKQKENLEQELFPTIKEAKSWVNKKGKDLDIKNNKTDAVAVSLIKNYDSTYSALRNMSDKGESISGISLKLMSDGKDLSPIEKAQIVFNTLNLPETKDLAENNDKFKKKYIQEKVHFYENYPDFGNKTLATQLAQKMEDKGMTGGFWSDPSLSTIDKAAELLIKDGTWGDTEKNYYKYNLRNKLSSFSGREAILPHADFVHKVGYGIYRGTSSILNGIRTALNKYVGGGILDPKGNSLFQNIGLLETEEDRAKRLKEESEKEPTVAPKRPLTKLGAGGEFLGQVLPVVGATSLGFSPTAAFALQSYGANEDEGLRRYGTANPLKVQSYALAGTVIDVAGMEFLPIKKISGQLKSFIGENAEKAIRKVATGGTTEIAAKKDLADIIVKKFGNVLKETGKTGGILTSYDFAHKVANAIFDGQHFDLKKELTDAAKDFPDKLLTGLPLSILGVIGKSEPKVEEVELQATPEAIPIRETAKRGEQVIREGIPTEMAKEAGKTITTPVEAKTIKPIEEPSKEQQLKDVQEGNVVTFNYENESQVPEVFRDKISSKGEIDGKPFVRVTVAKSLADYELGKKEGVEEVVSTPTEVKPEGKPTEAKLPSEKVVDVDKEIQKRQKIYAEPQGNQAEINKFVSDVNKYNNMPNGRLGKGTIQGLAERNRLMAEAERLGVSFKAHGKNKFILTDAKYIDKTSSNLAIDKNFKPLTERSEKAQSLLSEVDDLVSKYGLSPEMVLPNDIMGADGKRMNMGQIRNALKDIKNNIPSKGANLLLDAIEAMAEKGVVEIRDGQRLDSVPIDEYFQEMRNIGENSTKIEESAIKEAETMTDEALDIWLNEMSKEMEFESDEPYLSKEKQKEYDESITESPETEIGEQPEVQPTITGEEAKVGGEIGVEPVTEKLQAETGGVEPPTVETEVIGTTEPTKLGIKHSETEKIRERYGLPEYERETTKDVELEAEADKLISEGYDIEKLLKKIEGKTPPTGVENFILAKYIASLDAEIENNPNNKSLIENNTQKIKRVLEASDRIGSLQSEAFRTRKVLIPKDDSLASRFITEMEILGVDELTDSQREKITTEYQLEKTAKEAYEKRIAELEAENSRLKAEGEIKKLAKQKGAKRNYAQERKEIVQNIKDKLKELRKGTQSTIVPYANELITIAPDVAKLVKNLLDEGVVKFSDVVKKVYDSLKEDIPNIQEKDVVDLIAGNYNEKKPKKNELAAKLFELKQQAKLVDKYEKLLSGVEPKSEKKQIKVNQELADLRKKIKEHDLTQLANYKKRTQSQIEKVENDLKTGNFSKEVEKEPLKLDAEAIKLKDELIKVKTQRQVRIMREAYENRGRFEKNKDWILDKLNVPRSIMASMDYSAPLRQGLVAFVARPTIGFRALPGMFKSSFSQKNFDRFMYDMRDNPRFEIAQKSGLSITDPQSPFLQAKEEVFMNNTAEKIPLVGKMIKGSERAYVMFLNKIRFDSFNRIVDAYESQGKTMENSPELYKATAKLINSETGRGDLGALETAAPILNSLFFSPRLIASRFNLLTNWANPYWYKNTPKEVRVMYAKDMLKFIGAGMTILALAKMGGANVEDDPRSSDFGKIKVGKTRWDIWGGFQQYARLLSQMATGQKKTATTGEIQELDEKGKFGETRGDVAKRFFRGKLAPVPAIITDVLTGRKVTGEEVTLKDEALSYAIPLIINDVSDAVKDKGISALFTVGVPATFGIGVQTFGEREPQIPKKINFSGYTIDLNDKQYEFFEKKSKDKINEYISKAEKSPDFNKLTEIEKEKLRSVARKEAIRYTEYVIAKNQDFRKDFIEKSKVKMKEKQEREKENVKLKKIIK